MVQKERGWLKKPCAFLKNFTELSERQRIIDFSLRNAMSYGKKKSKPLMDKFKCWLDELYPTVLPKSPLGNAMNYCLKLWPGLTRFLDDGRLEVDNNLTE